jgi:hypothetical protein
MRLLYQGLFNAANVVGEACKGAALVTEVMNGLGYESNPKQVEILRFSKTALLVIHNDVVLGHDPGMCVCVCVSVCLSGRGTCGRTSSAPCGCSGRYLFFNIFFKHLYGNFKNICIYMYIYILKSVSLINLVVYVQLQRSLRSPWRTHSIQLQSSLCSSTISIYTIESHSKTHLLVKF